MFKLDGRWDVLVCEIRCEQIKFSIIEQTTSSKNEQLFLWNVGLLSQSNISNDCRNLE